jgi:hypothetical protein
MLKKWLRNKLDGPVYLDCYTSNPNAYKAARISSAIHHLPLWWKRLLPTVERSVMAELPKFKRPGSTMRHCVGLTDMFKKSFCIPLWSDLVIRLEPAMQDGYAWRYADGNSKLSEHAAFQRGDFMPPEHFQHIKLDSPWYLHCDEDINFLFFDPFWPSYEGEEVAIIPPGLLNFKYQPGTNVNMFIRKLPDEARDVTLKFNAPLAFITPLTERKVVLRHHLVSAEHILMHVVRPHGAFNDSYVKSKKAQIETMKQAQQEQTND